MQLLVTFNQIFVGKAINARNIISKVYFTEKYRDDSLQVMVRQYIIGGGIDRGNPL